MSRVLCPNCEDSTLTWEDIDDPNLLESGIMTCNKCGKTYKGFPEWEKAWKEKHNGNQT